RTPAFLPLLLSSRMKCNWYAVSRPLAASRSRPRRRTVYLGIEIGGTKLQLGLGAGDGVLNGLWRGTVDVSAGAEGIRRQITAAGPALRAGAGPGRAPGRGGGVGVGRGGGGGAAAHTP